MIFKTIKKPYELQNQLLQMKNLHKDATLTLMMNFRWNQLIYLFYFKTNQSSDVISASYFFVAAGMWSVFSRYNHRISAIVLLITIWIYFFITVMKTISICRARLIYSNAFFTTEMISVIGKPKYWRKLTSKMHQYSTIITLYKNKSDHKSQ